MRTQQGGTASREGGRKEGRKAARHCGLCALRKTEDRREERRHGTKWSNQGKKAKVGRVTGAVGSWEERKKQQRGSRGKRFQVSAGGGVLDPVERPVPHYPDIPPHTQPRDNSILTSTHENMEILTHSKHMRGSCQVPAFQTKTRLHTNTQRASKPSAVLQRKNKTNHTLVFLSHLHTENVETVKVWPTKH